MSPIVLQYILLALQALPYVIEAGGELAVEVGKIQSDLRLFQAQSRDPNAEEWGAQNAALSSALAALSGQKADLVKQIPAT